MIWNEEPESSDLVSSSGAPHCRVRHSAGCDTVQGAPHCRVHHIVGYATVQGAPQCRVRHSAGHATVQGAPHCGVRHSAGCATVQGVPQCRVRHSAGCATVQGTPQCRVRLKRQQAPLHLTLTPDLTRLAEAKILLASFSSDPRISVTLLWSAVFSGLLKNHGATPRLQVTSQRPQRPLPADHRYVHLVTTTSRPQVSAHILPKSTDKERLNTSSRLCYSSTYQKSALRSTLCRERFARRDHLYGFANRFQRFRWKPEHQPNRSTQ